MVRTETTDDGGSIVLLTRRDWWKGVIGWGLLWTSALVFYRYAYMAQPIAPTDGLNPTGLLGTTVLGVVSYAIVVAAVYYLGDLRIVPEGDA